MEDQMMMDVDDVSNLEHTMHLNPGTITKSRAISFDSHRSKPYLVTPDKQYGNVTISFPATWTVADFFDPNADSFGLTNIDRVLFPSLKCVGLDKFARVNQAFQTRFVNLLKRYDLRREVEKAGQKQIVFTGRSSGASLATLATLWLLETLRKSNVTNTASPICLTFGAPLVGDSVFHHAIERENWSSCFVNFVMKRDIVPRILLAPLSSVDQQFQPVLDYLNPANGLKSLPNSSFEEFYLNVMIKASATVSHAASELMGCTNMLLNNLASFNALSPYRPFGTYVFLGGNQTACLSRNSDAVLQLLFYCCQVEREKDICNKGSLKQQMDYPTEELSNNIINLDVLLENVTLTPGGGALLQPLDDLGVSTRGRICLLAAGELKNQKKRNKANMDMKKGQLTASLKKLIDYKDGCNIRDVCYYDAFKACRHETDFKANVDRLELAGMWDEIIDMLKTHKLPDNFEADEDWIRLGTEFRRVMEPLDIANYYRHDKHDDTGPYLDKGRPKRYRFTQKWLELLKRGESGGESCIMAKVEEFLLKGGMKEEIARLEKDIEKWIEEGALTKDVFMENSILVTWWNSLGPSHGSASPLKKFMPAQTLALSFVVSLSSLR